MIVDRNGFRLNIGIIIANDEGSIFLGRRIGHDDWQFPQGGIDQHETTEETLYRELKEEVGLDPKDVEIVSCTRGWLRYRLPHQFIRRNSSPLVIGQKQKWFLLRLRCSDQKIRLDQTQSPEFDSWCWVNYWHPLRDVIYFKKQVYRRALKELEPMLFPERRNINSQYYHDFIDGC